MSFTATSDPDPQAELEAAREHLRRVRERLTLGELDGSALVAAELRLQAAERKDQR